MSDFYISASILSADLSRLGEEIVQVYLAGANYIHFDVMDNHFVPNLSFGPALCESLSNFLLKNDIKIKIDVHLMVTNPEKLVSSFASAGASIINFHPETSQDISLLVENIYKHKMMVGIVFNPDKEIEIPSDIISYIDMVTLMSVYPGFGGQKFIQSTMDKARIAKDIMKSSKCRGLLAVDGGVNENNIQELQANGIEYFVLGASLFKSQNYKSFLSAVRKTLSREN